MAAAREVVSCVGVGKSATLWVEDGVEAGDEHVRRDASQQCFVDLRQHLPRRRSRSCGDSSQEGADPGHHQSRWHTLACSVPHSESHPTVGTNVEIVEISSYLSGGPAIGRYLPALY